MKNVTTVFLFIFIYLGISFPRFKNGINVGNCLFAQVNNIKNRSKDNQNDRKVNNTFTPPASNNNSNSYNSNSNKNTTSTPSKSNNSPSNSNSNSYNNNSKPTKSYNYSSTPSLESTSSKTQNSDDDISNNTCSDFDFCCVGCIGTFNSFFNGIDKHQKFLIQSKIVNPKITSFEVFALGALPFLYNNDSIGNQFFPNSIFVAPKIRANYGLFSTELRVTNLHQFGVGSYETTDWQILILNLFSKREFYLRAGSGFMHEKISNMFFYEHSVSSDILFTQKLSGTFDFRVSHDPQTQIFPRLETGWKFNYTLLEGKSADLNYSLGFLYQNYYQTEKLYFIQTGIGLVFH